MNVSRAERRVGSAIVVPAALVVGLAGGGLAAAASSIAPAHGEMVPTGRVSDLRARSEMVWIPAGMALVGSTRRQFVAAVRLCRQNLGPAGLTLCGVRLFGDEQPARTVVLAGYWMDRTEVTRAEYEACVRAGACTPAPAPPSLPAFQRPKAPVVNVSWYQARAYCRWRGKRLPTFAEWERAARGDTGRIWPWGSAWLAGACNVGGLGPTGRTFGPDGSDGAAYVATVGAYPWDESPYGLLDTCGNVSEWTATRYADLPRALGGLRGAGSNARVVKGGSWYMPPVFSRAAANLAYGPRVQRPFLGFRCARGIGDPLR